MRIHPSRLLTGAAVALVLLAGCGESESGPGKHRLVFTAAPSAGDWGAALAIQPVITIVDDDDLIVDTSTAMVTLTLIAGGGAVLSDTTPVAADSGVATFAGLSIDRPAADVRLVASAPGLVSDTSEAFTIGGPLPDHLVFITQQDTLTGGQADSTPMTAEVHTAAGVLVPWYKGVATLTKAPGSPNGSMIGLLSDSVRNGTVNFIAIQIDTAGAGYRLVVNAAGLAADTTAPFTVKIGRMSTTKSVWAIFDSPVVVGDSVQIFLSPRDLGGNRVPLFPDSLEMLKVSGTSAGTFGPWEDEGLGTGKAGPYKVIFTATVAGTPVKYMAVHQGYPGATMPGGITVNP